jgi:NADH-quinone oxidoreductase subunit L
VFLGLTGTSFKNGGGIFAVIAEGLALGFGVFIAIEEAGAALPYHDRSFVWLALPDGTNFVMGTLVSPLGALMLIVVNVVGFLVVLYSLEYMGKEEGLARYYAELMLFLTAMNALVLADNYLQFIIFWELVGLCSYLLIGFFWKKPEAAAAAKKAFLVTRVGDVMLFVGVFIFFTSFALDTSSAAISGYPGAVCGYHTINWACSGFVFTPPNADSGSTFLGTSALANAYASNPTLMTIGGIMILGGAAGKSAQFPLHTWLPDAMEGPTTVSALIHAATMVAAGVFLLAITSIYIGFTSNAAMVILAIGGFTSLFAGTMGLVARDIKRVVAYSTISQLGYMTMAVGAASLMMSYPGTAMFQLFTHAFFKALLFLCAGAVIHSVVTQDLFKMGGLSKAMPVTAYTMLIGALALSGIPPFSGFFSKDAVLSLTWSAAQKYPMALPFFILAMAAVFLTALYIFRLWFLCFSGDKTRADGEQHVHEPSWIMLGPLVVLAGLSIVSGFLPLFGGFSNLLPGASSFAVFGFTFTGWHVALASSTDLFLGLGSLALALCGIGLAYYFWGNGGVYRIPADSALQVPHTILVRKYYFDEAYDGLAHGVVLGFCRACDWFDRYVIDGTIHGFERIFAAASFKARQAQTGLVSSYVSWIVLGVVLIVAFFLYGVPHLSSLWGGG